MVWVGIADDLFKEEWVSRYPLHCMSACRRHCKSLVFDVESDDRMCIIWVSSNVKDVRDAESPDLLGIRRKCDRSRPLRAGFELLMFCKSARLPHTKAIQAKDARVKA